MTSPLLRAGGGSISTAVAIISALVLASCGTDNAPSASPVAEITGPPAGATDLSVADTVKALGDPSQATTGVWSVASHLQIGVYSIDERELLHGAQAPSDNTLFLYDFEIELLARLVNNAPDTWDQFAARMKAWDPSLAFSGQSLSKAIGDYYQAHPDDYSGQLLKAMNFDLAGPGSLTSFDEWLVLVGALILHADQAKLTASGVARSAAVLFAHEALPTLTTVKLIELSHGVVLAGVVVYDIAPPGPIDLTMGAGGPGQSAQFAIHATFVPPRRGKFGVPKSGGILKTYTCVFSVPYGPASKVPVVWTEHSLLRYGSFNPAPQVGSDGVFKTDSTGATPQLTYQTKQDPGRGHGQQMVSRGGIEFSSLGLDTHAPQCSQNDQLVKVKILEHGGWVRVNVHYHLPSYAVTIKASVACGNVAGTLDLSGNLTGTFEDPSDLSGTATYKVKGTGGNNFGGTTKLVGQLISSDTQLIFFSGSIGLFKGGALDGGVGPFTVPAGGGSTSKPIQCGSVTGTAKPVN